MFKIHLLLSNFHKIGGIVEALQACDRKDLLEVTKVTKQSLSGF